jgi:hypothetical protein
LDAVTGVRSWPSRARLKIAAASLEPRVTWIFGAPRSGTTWLASMLASLTQTALLDEPLIGAHLAAPVAAVTSLASPEDPLLFEANAARQDYFFSDGSSSAWVPGLRALLLDRFAAEVHARRGSRHGLIVKEPNGALAAPMLLRCLPRSRLLFVVRDGRDVVDSMVDGAMGGWISATHGTALQHDDRRDFLRRRAEHYVRTVAAVQTAYAAHAEPLRLRVTYEALRADAGTEVERILSWLGRDDVRGAVPAAVEQFSFERLPAEHKGTGQFARAATPGLWQEHFSADEQQVLDEVMGAALAELGYE